MNAFPFPRLLGIIVSSLFLFLAFPNLIILRGAWPLAWLFALPLFWSLAQHSFWVRLRWGLLFSLVFWGLFFYWMIPLNLLGYVALVSLFSLPTIVFCTIFQLPVFSTKSIIYHSKKVYYFERILRRVLTGKGVEVLLPAAVWVSSEFWLSKLLGGFSWNLGYSQAFYPPNIQLAEITGAYGISFALILFNYSVFRTLTQRDGRLFYMFAALSVVLLFSWFGFVKLTPPSLKSPQSSFLTAGVVQPNVDPRKKMLPDYAMEITEKHLDYSRASIKEQRLQILIWPETAIPDDFLKRWPLREKITQMAREAGGYLLTGLVLKEENSFFNAAALINKNGAIEDIYRKQYLVPFAEYVPGRQHFSFLSDLLLAGHEGFYPGRSSGVFLLKLKLTGHKVVTSRLGIVICSENMYPALLRDLKNKGSQASVVLINDGWFAYPSVMLLHAQATVLRAVETRMPLVQATNSGWSFWVDDKGWIKNYPDGLKTLNHATYFVFPIPLVEVQTFYAQKGDIFAWGCSVFVIMTWLAGWILKLINSRKSY